jgi:signal transduction histidine kinase
MRVVWPDRPHLAHAARVAAVATMVIAVVYVLVAGALDVFFARRVLWEVDQGLSERLTDVIHAPGLGASRSAPDDQNTDGAPMFVWWLPQHGPAQALTVGSPAVPLHGEITSGAPRTASTGGVTYRLEAAPYRGGWLIVDQDLAGPSHIDQVLFVGELIIGPILLLAVFAGSLIIGLQAVGPVELARRRLLEFTADASHELRTPLTVIEAEIELARSVPVNPAADREALDHVARESRRLKRIVEDLLWLARFDSAPPPPDREPVDLTAVVEGSAARFSAVAGARDLVLTTLRVGDGPTWVDATPEWLDRLAGTLIDNACRYAPLGGAVRVSVGGAGGRVSLVVEDSGPGIPPAERARLFDRFRRATDHPEGAGLGLAIADSVVRITGGRWRVGESTLGGALMEVSWRRGAAPAWSVPAPAVPIRGAAPTVDA